MRPHRPHSSCLAGSRIRQVRTWAGRPAIGLDRVAARSVIRIGAGRTTTSQEILTAPSQIASAASLLTGARTMQSHVMNMSVT